MKIAFIGGGNMARSLIGGMIENGYQRDHITVSDPLPATTRLLNEDFGITTSDDNRMAASGAQAIVLAVKPQQMRDVTAGLGNAADGKLTISIAAGVLSKDIVAWSDGAPAVVRCMPNTPALLRCGATALYARDDVASDQRNSAESILSAVGSIAWVDDESQLDAITALSGSGPAYFFLLIESMAAAGEKLGLDKALAEQFAIQTALGAANMASTGEVSPSELRRRVTSPAGTTEAALNSFSDSNFKTIVEHAMNAANNRAVELGSELGDG